MFIKDKYSNSTEHTSREDFYTERLSTKKKKANNARWVELRADLIDNSSTENQDPELLEKYRINYNYWAGRGNPDAYKDRVGGAAVSTGDGDSEDVHDAAYEQTQHFDIIGVIAKGMHGEQRKRPFSFMGVDESRYSHNQKKRDQLALLQSSIERNIISKIRNEAMMNIMQQSQIEDHHS
jgi:hypothetical protein